MDIPILFITPLIYALIVYFGVGLTITFGNFFYFYLILVLVVFGSSSYGYFLSSCISNIDTAIAVGPLLITPIVLFGGVFTNVDTYPGWIKWL